MRDDSNSTARVAHRPRKLHLLYHELKPSRSEYLYAVETSAFADHVRLFADILQNPFGERFLPVVTFDDGHASDFAQALPILESAGLKAHFFITAGWTGNKPGYMGWNELRGLVAAGHTIGAHSWSHALLTNCDDAKRRTELSRSREALQDNLGFPITTMSLPGGRHNDRVLQACKEAGYTTVYTSIPRAETDPFGFTVGRVNIRGDVTLDWLTALLQIDSGLLSRMERQYRLKARAKKLLGDRLYARVWAILNRQGNNTEEGEAAEA